MLYTSEKIGDQWNADLIDFHVKMFTKFSGAKTYLIYHLLRISKIYGCVLSGYYVKGYSA